MPTKFDDFSERAHQDYQNISTERKTNRWILRTIMQKYGFKEIPTEWWHYDLIGWDKYPVKDLSFDEIENFNR